jgi:hypothetical protein
MEMTGCIARARRPVSQQPTCIELFLSISEGEEAEEEEEEEEGGGEGSIAIAG